MIRSDNIGTIAKSLLKAQQAMGSVTKDAKNPYFKSSYATLNAVREACTPALNSNGITLLQPTVVLDGKQYVETTLLHESGEYLSCLTEVVVGKANDAQSTGSGLSYARRYGLMSMLSLAAEDDDGNGATGKAAIPTPTPIKVAPVATAPAAATEAPAKKKVTFSKKAEDSI